MSPSWIVPLDDPAAADPALVGGKGAGLHRLLGARGAGAGRVRGDHRGVRRRALDEFAQARLEAPLRALPADAAPARIESVAAAVRAAVLDAVVDCDRYWTRCAPATPSGGLGQVAVRSSAAAEDAAEASFAGEHDSFLELSGPDAVAEAVRPVLGQPVHRSRGVLPGRAGRRRRWPSSCSRWCRPARPGCS